MEIINKTPYEIFTVMVNFADQLTAGETVTAVASASSSPTNLVTASTFDTSSITVTIAGGTANTLNALTVRCSTSLGNKYELEVPIQVQAEPMGYFQKSPDEIIVVAADFAEVLINGDTISSQTVTAVDNSTGLSASVIVGYSKDGTKIKFAMTSGTLNVSYSIAVRIVTVAAKQFESIIVGKIKEAI